ncbi:MAG TPA: NAD(P)/FAD-dependent oxidoreductase [Candidatus Acidoferrales bacterium]|nr:NAD(P)/FAD-dependent oxidoreductase [Candidatus Acidoferrales bacterium]
MVQFDIVTVGGGLAGSAFAAAMAQRSVRVLVLEQETRFRDRIRGEFLCPWGVAEVKALGLLETFYRAGARDIAWVDMGMGPRDLVATTKPQLPGISYFHPELQEALLDAAQKAGAEVRRGAAVRKIEAGAKPVLECDGNGSVDRVTARLIVAADGRNSAARKWAGFQSTRDDHPFLLAGVLLGGVTFRQDMCSFVFNSDLGTVTGTVPQNKGRVRAYFGYPTSSTYRLQGKGNLPLFLGESAKTTPMLAEAYAKAASDGPLASFDANDSWTQHPYRDGVALIGDAAGTSDPSFGQGMSLTFRDARVLRDHLLQHSDWDRAAHRYAEEHDSYFANCHSASQMLRTVFQEQTPEAKRIQQRAFPLIAQDPTRIPDHLMSGPDLPTDEAVRSRFFGES